jgi:antitoxin (DNA-binding transcriptional repressor) of toxin-antitoxin stability system
VREVEEAINGFYDAAMKKTVTSAEVVENWQTLVNDIAHDGDEVVVTLDGIPILKLVAFEANNQSRANDDGPMAGSILHQGDIVSPIEWNANDAPSGEQSESNGLVLYNGRWMIPAAAERERSIEHLRGSGKILGDIVSPIDDVEWNTYE